MVSLTTFHALRAIPSRKYSWGLSVKSSRRKTFRAYTCMALVGKTCIRYSNMASFQGAATSNGEMTGKYTWRNTFRSL